MHPLIVTLRLDDESSRFFDALRREYFPPERNHLSAHVTLFHALPPNRRDSVRADLARAAAARTAFPVAVTGLRFLGRGVAYDLAAPELLDLHAQLRSRWAATLTAQDGQKLSPHVTVQNKVAPDTARRLFEGLRRDFSPRHAQGIGLELWEYRGGPWAFLQAYPFSA
jgi:2'-5' RNA ligase